MDLLQGPMGEALVGQLAQKAGIDKSTASSAAQLAIPALLGGLQKNSAKEDGAKQLESALERDHDGSILDDLEGVLGQEKNQINGEKILGHILGGKQNAVQQMIGQQTGMQSGQAGQLLSQLAPVLMGYLGKQKKDQGLDIGGLVGMLTNNKETAEKKMAGDNSLLTAILDSDGDGDITDDVTRIGMKVLGNLFKR